MPSIATLLTAAIGATVVLAHGSHHDRPVLERGIAAAHHKAARHARRGDARASSRMVRSLKKNNHAKRGQQVYSTQAQYYAKTGGYSACHTYFDDESMVFSLPTGLWPDVYSPSSLCGKKVVATNPATGTSLTLTVQDASWFAGSVQVPVGVFRKLGGDEQTGVLPIEFHFVDDGLNLPESTAGASDIFGASSSVVRAAAETSAASVASVKAQVAAVSIKSTTTTFSAAAETTTQAPATTTTEAPKTTAKPEYDSASAASAFSAAAASSKAAADAAAAAASSSSAAAAAEASKSAEAAAAAAASSSSAAAAAAASSSEAAAAAATTTTTEAAPEPTSGGDSDGGSNGNTGGNVHTGGYATYYLQNGNPGHCGTVAQESDKVIALPSAIYDNGSHCGQQIRITRVSDGAQVVATVRDSCPTCVNNDSLDLSVGAFTAIATESEGMVPITWEYI